MNGSNVLDNDDLQLDDQYGGFEDPAATGPEDGIVVRRNAALSAVVGGLASAVAIAYLARATGTGAWLDWVLFLVMGGLAAVHLLGLLDSRGPLLVADGHGVRIREGRAWHGMTWDSLLSIEHLPRRGMIHDGRLDVVLTGPEGAEQVLSVPLSMSTRVASTDPDLTSALLALTDGRTEVVELDPTLPLDEAEDEAEDEDGAAEPAEAGDVAGHVEEDALVAREPVAHEPVSEPVVPAEPAAEQAHEEDEDREPAGPRLHDPRPALARGIGAIAARLSRRSSDGGPVVPAAEPVPVAPFALDLPADPADQSADQPQASPTPTPLRSPVTAVRAETVHDGLALDAVHGANALDLGDGVTPVSRTLPEARELRRPGSVDLVEDTQVWGARAGAATPTPVVIDGFAIEAPVQPAADPVIGPELAAARARIGLSVDQLADRTRIRPHVIESIEVDDFAPCGGDFYARGHLRTLARVLGVDVAPLLASYDERYADAPIDPRRVFEAELATGANGSIRGTRGGPNWSVLVAAVMALVLAWSVARLVMDSPVDLNGEALVLNGSRGIDNGSSQVGKPVSVLLTAAGGGTNVVVRDGSNEIVFSGDLAFGESKELKVAPPVRVQSSDGSLEVGVAGGEPEAVGETGQPAKGTFVAPAAE
ncbi:helix-turn-helix domain-containing protein [Nocardioides sp. Arc9.136]|uniref:helix-turn-helix domain-containing protein n=1 Tax=Nocardioides sp. Arc9.136 TaxID=2996826 RepID=UPI0026660784|nr:helix-turn-helix domain-containing protein [Nocardioides sp. Arc9.136]WKN46943.1 helix-turn-helix domain-containing protein [Nocardioides sp. Arc9.136]